MMRLSILLFLLLPVMAPATEVFTCVDADGVRLFSETPLEQCKGDTELVILDDVAPSQSDDRYSVINQLKRFEKRRDAEQRAKLEKQLLEAKLRELQRQETASQQAQAPAPPVTVQPQPIFFPSRAGIFPQLGQRFPRNRNRSRSRNRNQGPRVESPSQPRRGIPSR